MPFKIWSSSALPHVILWSTKTIKSILKIWFANMWNQLQDPAPHLFFCLSSRRQPSPCFLKPVQSEFPYRIIHQLLVAHFLIDDQLLLKFIQGRHTGEAICTKNNLFVLCDGVLMAFSSSSFVFIQFRRGIFYFFASLTVTSCSFIIFFVTLRQVTNIFFASLLHHNKSIIIITQSVTLLVFFTLRHIPCL